MFPDQYGHEDYITTNRPDLLDDYGKEWYNHCIAARFVPLEVNNNYSKYNGRTINILSVWAYKKENAHVLYLLMPALRAMASHVPTDTYVTCGAGRFGAFAPFHISTLTSHSAARGHRYWQLRQTSESRL